MSQTGHCIAGLCAEEALVHQSSAYEMQHMQLVIAAAQLLLHRRRRPAQRQDQQEGQQHAVLAAPRGGGSGFAPVVSAVPGVPRSSGAAPAAAASAGKCSCIVSWIACDCLIQWSLTEVWESNRVACF